MHIHFEKTINAKCDCNILSMSWMGKVPDELPEEEGWKLNRTSYYQEGWLATGNVRGILGVTHTTSQWKAGSPNQPGSNRTNYNLRGHRAQITLVQWNEPYQKLASCDSSGIIFVWIKFEGRWSIELINDRNTPVTHFSWSHDGRMALICYQDGFVLVGSVAGQRYWSSMLNLSSTITAGIWTPDDQRVYFGTSNGQIIVMDVHGMMISQVQLPIDCPITHLSWSCEKFKMEENDDSDAMNQFHSKNFLVLAVGFQNGLVYIMKNYDDLSPVSIYTGLQGLHMEWSNSGEYLAVAGSRTVDCINEAGVRNIEWQNSLHFYSHYGARLINVNIPTTSSPITALTWGHNDKRLFVAAGKVIHVGWISKRIASLQLLCRLSIYRSISTETCVSHLPLPLPVRALISSLHTQTVISNLPSLKDLREFATHPPTANQRIYCTMIRHDEDSVQSSGTVYTLYAEFLGGLVPILKGKRTSKIRPEFIIYDPQDFGNPGKDSTKNRIQETNIQNKKEQNNASSGSNILNWTDDSDSSDVDLCASPRLQRRRRNRNRNMLRQRENSRSREEGPWERHRGTDGNNEILLPLSLPQEEFNPNQLSYNDTLPEAHRIVEITSNIWGTKFKIIGLAKYLPDSLGYITYKTSLLHLQPRQMTLVMTELRDDIFLTPSDALSLSYYGDEDRDDDDFSVILGANDFPASDRYYTGSIPGSAPNRCFLQSRNTPHSTPRRQPSHQQQQQHQLQQLQRTDFENEIIQLRDSIRQLSRATELLPTTYSSVQVQTSISQCCNTYYPDDDHHDVSCSSTLGVGRSSNSGETQSSVSIMATPSTPVHNHNAPLRVKTRAHIENIDENTATTNTGHSLSRTSSSIRSPTRRCWTASTTGTEAQRNTTQSSSSVPVTAPIHVRRSVSASYLDNVDRQLLVPVDMVLTNTQTMNPKRLVLIKSRDTPKPRLSETGKSKSWDSYDRNWWKLNQGQGGNGTRSGTSGFGRCPNCKLPTTANFSGKSNKPCSSKDFEDLIQTVNEPESVTAVLSTPMHRTIPTVEPEAQPQPKPPSAPIHRRSLSLLTPLLRRRDLRNNKNTNSPNKKSSKSDASSSDMDSSRNYIPPGSPTHTRSTSSPNTPASTRRSNFFSAASSPIRQLFANSPLLSRRKNRSNSTNSQPNRKQIPNLQNNILESSDDESDFGNNVSGRNNVNGIGFHSTPHSTIPRSSILFPSNSFKDLETFQKNQLRLKLNKKKIHNTEKSPKYIRRREFVMTNKAPMWNETSQVYQLDFGGRVTQESAKNFQIEFRGKQFGRIEGNAYTLDFQYPFSAIQAFAVALANVTQRLK